MQKVSKSIFLEMKSWNNGLVDTFFLIQPKASSLSSQIPLKNKETFEKVSKKSKPLRGDSFGPPLLGLGQLD
ncbi:hypothetical protein [Croceimicrobium sp.]|uniref:hypothetical protein n=1 Tax=Croceimicrobium sp. TaxID=2828340 RepID=UPI003BA9E94E